MHGAHDASPAQASYSVAQCCARHCTQVNPSQFVRQSFAHVVHAQLVTPVNALLAMQAERNASKHCVQLGSPEHVAIGPLQLVVRHALHAAASPASVPASRREGGRLPVGTPVSAAAASDGSLAGAG
jgi:hypothetical protein